MSEENEIGYCKPPKHRQFKKGRSGNPKGRPKGSRNFKTDVKDTLEEPVRLTESGRCRTVSTQTALLKRLREKALKGDAHSLDRLLLLAQAYNDEEVTKEATQFSLTDSQVVEGFKARTLRNAGLAQPNGSDTAEAASSQGAVEANHNDDPPEGEEDEDACLG